MLYLFVMNFSYYLLVEIIDQYFILYLFSLLQQFSLFFLIAGDDIVPAHPLCLFLEMYGGPERPPATRRVGVYPSRSRVKTVRILVLKVRKKEVKK